MADRDRIRRAVGDRRWDWAGRSRWRRESSRRPAEARPAGRPRAAYPPAIAAALGVLCQIGYPLTAGTARDLLTVLSVLFLAAAAVAHAWITHGGRLAAILAVVFVGGGLAAELIGLHTGVPFGDYAYSDRLGPAVGGVPLLVGLAWLMSAWPCWVAAARLTRSPWIRATVAAWALAAWDLFLDPQMVDEGYWTWRAPTPSLPGVDTVPLTNHLGWLLVSLVLMFAFAALTRDAATTPPGTGPGGDVVPLAVLGWMWLSSVLAHAAFFGLPASALWGGIGLGVVAGPALWRAAGPPLMRAARRRR